MSDRRERVAEAIHNAHMMSDPTDEWRYALADAALAVIDAEPTEAEIEAAWQAYKAHPTPWPTPHPACPHDGYAEELEQARIQGMRAALIAARKARS